jgi:hypothetical protein
MIIIIIIINYYYYIIINYYYLLFLASSIIITTILCYYIIVFVCTNMNEEAVSVKSVDLLYVHRTCYSIFSYHIEKTNIYCCYFSND